MIPAHAQRVIVDLARPIQAFKLMFNGRLNDRDLFELLDQITWISGTFEETDLDVMFNELVALELDIFDDPHVLWDAPETTRFCNACMAMGATVHAVFEQYRLLDPIAEFPFPFALEHLSHGRAVFVRCETEQIP